MLGVVKKRKNLDKFIYQALRDVVKLGGDNVIQNFEEKITDLRVKGYRKENGLSTLVMYTEDDKEMEEDFHDNSEDSHIENGEKETLFMETESKARRRFYRNGPYQSRPSSRDSRYSGSSRRQSQYARSRRDRSCGRSGSNPRIPAQSSQSFSWCIGCRCGTCNQVRTDCQEIKKILEGLDTKKIHEVSTKESSATSINLCSQDVVKGKEMEMMINYTYKDSGSRA